MTWRFIQTGRRSAAENLAIDEAILQSYCAGKTPPTLRFYSWQPAAVSLGYSQHAKQTVNWDFCRRQGFDVVRRLTGGLAVLHDDEWAYSLVIGEKEPSVPATITGSYRYLNQALLAGLRHFGVDAQLSMPQAAYSQKKPTLVSTVGFDSTLGYEITYRGRKLLGSAQVRKHGAILQHGSLLLSFSPEKVTAAFSDESPQQRVAKAQALSQRTTSLWTIMHQTILWRELCHVMRQGFTETLAIELVFGELTAEELVLSRTLTEQKYRQTAWTLKR